MYQEFYGLRELPFELTPNPQFLFLTPQHREALSNLQHGVQARKVVTLLIGEAGTGKTTLIRALLKGMESASAYFLYLNNPTLTRAEFIELLAEGFKLSRSATSSKASLLREIELSLKAHTDAGRLTALIVDEAQSLSEELLEEIRLLANIETDSMKLLPVILAGHPELAERLNKPALRQLKQRVSLRCDLRPLDLHETAAYIQARIRAAGGASNRLFTREAVIVIHERSGGIPRLINILCDNSLVSGFAAESLPVNRSIVLDVCNDFDMPGAASKFDLPDWVGKHSKGALFDSDVVKPAPAEELLASSGATGSVQRVLKAARAWRIGLF